MTWLRTHHHRVLASAIMGRGNIYTLDTVRMFAGRAHVMWPVHRRVTPWTGG